MTLRDHGYLLRRFVEFVEGTGATYITIDLALKWATENTDPLRYSRIRRLDMVRGFARYCSSRDRRTQVPPPDLLPRRHCRRPPFIYRDEDIRRLLNAARKLPSATGLRPHTFETLFDLYVATGLRTSEALRLDRKRHSGYLQSGDLVIGLVGGG